MYPTYDGINQPSSFLTPNTRSGPQARLWGRLSVLLFVAKEMQSRSDAIDVTSILMSLLLFVSWRFVSDRTLSSIPILGAFWEITSLSPIGQKNVYILIKITKLLIPFLNIIKGHILYIKYIIFIYMYIYHSRVLLVSPIHYMRHISLH